MADKKISALTGASTPLAGTEVLPIVQSGATVKVAVSDLTAGRTVGMASLGVGTAATGTRLVNILSTAGVSPLVAVGPNAYVAVDNAGTGINYYSSNVSHVFEGVSGGNVLVLDSVTKNVSVISGNVSINTSGKGIDFSATAGTGTSELLNDYEEGTWTPTILFDGASTGVTYSLQSGVYTKVGRQVTLEFDVRLSNKGSSTGTWQIGGFPFASGTLGTGNLNYQTGGIGINQLGQIRITSGSSSGSLNYVVAGSTNQYIDTDATNSSICIGQIVYFV